MKKLLIMFAAIFVLANFSHAQQTAVIDSELQQVLESSSEELITVNVVLKSEIDKAKVKALRSAARDRNVARESVARAFKEHSENSQAAVLAILVDAEKSGKASEILSHWMSNSITCNATKEVIYVLASHPDVHAIGYDKELKIVDSVEEYDVAPAAAFNATPHVLQVNADDVWAQGYTGKNVVVAVLDSGTNPDHYDLKDHLWVGYADTDGDGEKDDVINGWNFIAGNSDITDDFGHGTHCAGIVCGDGTVGNVTGVAPDATLMTVKIVNRAGGGSVAKMISGVEFAVENGAHVLSMSLGYKQNQISSADIVALRRLFENVLEAGVVVCAAAGNDGNASGELLNIDYPAACPPPYIHPDQQENAGGRTSVICVGSVNASDGYVNTSSIGPVTWQGTEFNDYPFDDKHIGLIRPDVCAPGELVYSLKHDVNDKYKYMSGTSQATPCVAGVIALMLEKNSTLTPAQICETLETTAKKLSDSKNNYTGSGRVDALAAVNSVKAANEKPFIELAEYSPKSFAAGGSINIGFEVLNSGKGSAENDVTVKLVTDDPYITIVKGDLNLGKLASGKSSEGEFVVNADAATPNGHTAYMDMVITSGSYVRHCDMAVKVVGEPRIVCRSFTPESIKPGNNVKISVDFVNDGTVATTGNTTVSMSTKSPYITLVTDEVTLGVMDVNEVKTAEFTINVSESAPDNSSASFDFYATPDNYSVIKDVAYEFEQSLDENGRVLDGFDGWTTFDASNDGRNHPWWHSSVSGVHMVENAGTACSGKGHIMSEAYCLAALIAYDVPVDNYLVSPKLKVTSNSQFCFMARAHSAWYYNEHFGVAVSEKGNNSASDFTTIKEWSIEKEDGCDWIKFDVDLSAYSGKEIYVAIRHFFTSEQWVEFGNGLDYVYILHVDDAVFTNVIDVSTRFVYNNYSYFTVGVEGNPLPAPSNVAATVNAQTVSITWDAVANAQKYCVYRDGEYLATTTGLSYTDSGLNSGTEYKYAVSALYNGKEYERSAAVSVTTAQADYSVKIKSVAIEELVPGDNVIEITLVNNGKYEQKSRSSVFLSSDNPYVTIKTEKVGMSYLKVAEERTVSFTVVIDEMAPNADEIKFNLRVEELFEDKNVWTCPFELKVNNPNVPTAIENVEQNVADENVYDLSGRKVENPVKGVYIVNGKKQYVR